MSYDPLNPTVDEDDAGSIVSSTTSQQPSLPTRQMNSRRDVQAVIFKAPVRVTEDELEARALQELLEVAATAPEMAEEAPTEDLQEQKPDIAASAAAAAEKAKELQAAAKKRKRKKKKKAFISSNDFDLYVQGLPGDLTLEEFASFFSKCGIIKKNEAAEPKIKLYQDSEGRPKGDGLICYFKKESVDLAMQLLDGTEIRPGHPVKLQKAVFEMKGQFQPKSRKPGNKKKKGYDQAKELDWDEDDRKHTVIKNMFSPEEALEDPNFAKELKKDIEAEVVNKCGAVDHVKVFERNPEGVVCIIFCEHEAAEKCLKLMNGRFFAKRELTAFYYDGFTNYEVGESEEEKALRIAKWEKWLAEQPDGDDADVEGDAPTP